MQIPKRLAYILERDQPLDGAVKLSVSQFEPWIKHSNLPFFPEYTKHDIEHIEAVLRTATGLICDDGWEAITPSDAAVLVLSVLLHDCAMHISEDGFISLFGEDRRDKSVTGMADKPWHVLWEEFYGEASRFNGRKLIRLFGDTQPVRRPPPDPNELTKRDRLLIGEFLRRHHPRIAQEIACFGVPTKNKTTLVLEGISGTASHIAGLSGIVARSHGANVRAYLPYLQSHFDVRQYKGVHPVFLMTLLRVADYVQIEAERAPAQVLQVKQLASPVSQGEWITHHAIKDVRHTHEDPEALFVDAFPDDVKTFFRVQSWLRGIQKELDDSWAVLGEVYGRYEGLNRLGIILRRIRSSIDDVAAFSKRIAYSPIHAAFRGSDADLLKLLIEPLYGHHPEVGLRELIQNSVDAVREIEQYRKDVLGGGETPQTVQDGDVIVSIEKGNDVSWVTIGDKGIGMTQEIIVNYFLTAGASFRRSEDWRKVFETSEGKSKVLRAGRFGVGALAAFLLGPKIEVSTRHVEESRGIEFTASIDTDSIELRRMDRPVGTTIKIQIADALAKRLEEAANRSPYSPQGDEDIDWDWYCHAQPSVKRVVLGKGINQKYTQPAVGEKVPPEWRYISNADFAGILWTYTKAPALVCNGIKILAEKEEWNQPMETAKWRERFGLKVPNVSVFDADGHLPVNLQRSGLTETRYPFDEALANDVIRDFIAFALCNGPTSPVRNFATDQSVASLRYPGSVRTTGSWRNKASGDWYFTDQGFGYLDAAILRNRGFNSVLVIRPGERTPKAVQFVAPSSVPVILIPGDDTVRNLDEWIKTTAELGLGLGIASDANRDVNWAQSGHSVLESMKRCGARLLVSGFTFKRATGEEKVPKWLQRALKQEWDENNWHLLTIGNCPSPRFDFKSIVRTSGANLGSHTTITEIYLDSQQEIQASPIGGKWMQIMKNAEIPFALAKRQKELRCAYAELSKYVKAYELTRKTAKTNP